MWNIFAWCKICNRYLYVYIYNNTSVCKILSVIKLFLSLAILNIKASTKTNRISIKIVIKWHEVMCWCSSYFLKQNRFHTYQLILILFVHKTSKEETISFHTWPQNKAKEHSIALLYFMLYIRLKKNIYISH